MKATPSAQNRIRMLREGASMKPVDIASRLGVGEATVVRWEAGKVQIPDRQKLALAELFQVSVPFLMGWPDTGADGNDDAARSAA